MEGQPSRPADRRRSLLQISPMRYVVTALIAFVLGFACHFAVSTFKQTDAAQIQKHWRAIDDYNEYMVDPQNQETIDGMVAVRNAPDPEPHLAALVAFGELEHADLILPNAPNSPEANRYWMQYVEEHDDIIYSIGNSTYSAFQPSGKPPLQLKLWYRPSAEGKIQDLVQHLESMATDSSEQTDEREPELAGWLASLGNVNSRPRYRNRSSPPIYR